MTEIISLTHSNHNQVIEAVSNVLMHDGLVVLPSDTVYGLAVDATSRAGVAKLLAFKQRPAGMAISVFVGDMEMAKRYVHMSASQEMRLKEMLPGAYTLILPDKGAVSKDIVSEKSTLGIRIPKYAFANELVRKYGQPITATSANMHGRSPHYSVEALLNALPKKKKDMIDLIVDAGKLPRNKPSTVVDLTGSNIEVLRKGSGEISGEKRISHSEDDTQALAKELLEKYDQTLLKRPVVFMLYGDVGAGKTVFVKGIGQALGIKRIASPTFVIYYEYIVNTPTVKNLYHFDLYRIKNAEEYKNLGIAGLLQPGNLLCIEWSEKSKALMSLLNEKASVVHVFFEHGDAFNAPRTIMISQ